MYFLKTVHSVCLSLFELPFYIQFRRETRVFGISLMLTEKGNRSCLPGQARKRALYKA